MSQELELRAIYGKLIATRQHAQHVTTVLQQFLKDCRIYTPIKVLEPQNKTGLEETWFWFQWPRYQYQEERLLTAFQAMELLKMASTIEKWQIMPMMQIPQYKPLPELEDLPLETAEKENE